MIQGVNVLLCSMSSSVLFNSYVLVASFTGSVFKPSTRLESAPQDRSFGSSDSDEEVSFDFSVSLSGMTADTFFALSEPDKSLVEGSDGNP